MVQEMTRPAFLRIWQRLGKERRGVYLLFAVQILLAAGGIWFALEMRDTIDFAVSGEREGFWRAILTLAGIAAGMIFLRTAGREIEERTRAGIENACKRQLFSALMEKKPADVTAKHTGEWMNRLTSDTVVCANGATDILPGLAGMTVRLLGAAGMILVLAPRFALCLLPVGLVLLSATFFMRKRLKILHKRVQEADGELRICLQERLENLLIVRSFAKETEAVSAADREMEAHRGARIRKIRFSNLSSTLFSIAMQGIYLFSLGYFGIGILTKSVSYGTLTAVLELVGQLRLPLVNLTGYLPRWSAMTASAERLCEAEELKDDCPERKHSLPEVLRFYQTEFSALRLKDASFSFPVRGEELLLKNISLQLPKGSITAITGPSGCGKSTLLKLIMAFYPLSGGRAELLGQNGEAAALSGIWHRMFAYVPQGSGLMSGTIREVVAFSEDPAQQDTERIWHALKIACAEDFVRVLPQKLDTPLGERGQGISEGQMQRLAIARAVYAEHPILLLDEATSALDEQTEQNLLKQLRSMTDRTMLLVTHRPAALRFCDQIFQLKEGRLKPLAH